MTTQQPLMALKRPFKFNFRQLIGQFQISEIGTALNLNLAFKWRHRLLMSLIFLHILWHQIWHHQKCLYRFQSVKILKNLTLLTFDFFSLINRGNITWLTCSRDTASIILLLYDHVRVMNRLEIKELHRRCLSDRTVSKTNTVCPTNCVILRILGQRQNKHKWQGSAFWLFTR